MDHQLFARVLPALADDRRRRVCRYLAEQGESTATLDELAEALGPEQRSGRPPPGGRPDDGDRVAIELHHVHLPKLDDARVVEYCPDRRVVEAGDALPVADELARTADVDDRWTGERDIP